MARPINTVPASEYYVSVEGNDNWSGTLPAPNAEATDGPFAGIGQASKVIAGLKASGRLPEHVTVFLRAGRYPVEKPIQFGPADSAPVTYAAYPGETPILDGGRRIEGWTVETVNGTQAWVAEVPEVADGKWHFRQLFVNGRRRSRARLPKEGRYRIAEVPGMPLPSGWDAARYTRFRLGDGEMKAWRNLTDVEIVAFHFWIDERFPVADFDEETQMITTARGSRAPLVEAFGDKLAPCFIENVFEALTEPGEWYLDRPAGKLYYIPLPGEEMETTEVFAPKVRQILRLVGDPASNRYVQFLRFEGLTFQHTDWVQPGADIGEEVRLDADRSVSRYSRGNDAGCSQAACDVPGAIYMSGVRNCAVEDCRIANIGWYGVELGDGSHGVRIVGNEIFDLGAGGVKINGAAWNEPIHLQTGNNRVTDNHIHECGRVFHCGIGVLSMHSFGNAISHNHIHDLYYSGISCGWVWGYRPSISRDNMIEKNHIHDVGQGLLSDMGGIYTLGVQPGTVLRGNLIHDVEKLNYGAWCIYPDEGSSHMLIENNVCFRTNGEVFHQHYGRENIVRNNIFAFGADSVAAHGRADLQHKAFSFERNIFITDARPIFKGGYSARLEWKNLRSDLNLLWDVSGASLSFTDRDTTVDLDGWRALGHDRHSVPADPKCRDPQGGDFTLAPDSPAITELGFEPIDISDVGPRPKEQREA